MKEALALIQQIIDEHKAILRRFKTLDRVANDAEAMRSFEQAKDSFMPGRFDQRKGLGKLEKLSSLINQGLQAHFDREETALLTVFEEQATRELTSAFQSLLLEHKDIRNRLADTIRFVSQLTGKELSRHDWEATACDMRAHITHTQKLLKAHVRSEEELLLSLRQRLSGEK